MFTLKNDIFFVLGIRYLSMRLSFIFSRNKKVEQYIKKKIHKLNVVLG